MSPPLARRYALLLMVLVPLLWSMAGIFTRQLAEVRNVEIVFWRSFFTALFVAAYLLTAGKSRFWHSLKNMGWPGFLSAAMWAVIFTCFMLSLALTTVANTLIVGSITPLLTAFFAWLFLGQKTSRRTWVAIVLAFMGVAWIFAGNVDGLEGAHLAGLLFALAVPFAYAINYMVFSRAGKNIDMMPAIFLGGVLSSAAMIPLAFPLEAPVSDIGILAVLGIFQLGVPCLLLVYVSRFLLPAEMALVAMLEIVLGPLWVWIGINEVPSGETLTGGFVVLLCLLSHEVASMLHMRKKKDAEAITEKKQ
ncbi:DMT family transporter [Oxalobacter sp. OttesenSCG-928-P03]|nr:DMT family transporter [Oxalobacter sp. OttesenSCG-928-P03]